MAEMIGLSYVKKAAEPEDFEGLYEALFDRKLGNLTEELNSDRTSPDVALAKGLRFRLSHLRLEKSKDSK